MAKQALIESVLLESDGPDIVLARDPVGLTYLALMVGTEESGDQFLAVPISSKRLADVRAGAIDLRLAFEAPETAERYAGLFRRIDGAPSLMLESVSEIPEAWLPAAGFLLSYFDEAVPDSDVVLEAAERNAPVVVCTLNPPESYESPKINAQRLAEALSSFQSLVRHALTRGLANATQAWRSHFAGTDAHVLQVFSFSPGSFKIHLQAKVGADLAGESALGMAMQKVDELTAILDDPDSALEVIRSNRGHVIAAYKALLRFVVEQETPVDYRWAGPQMASPLGRKIQPVAAAQIYELLNARQELSIEEVTFVGRMAKVDSLRGSWTLIHDEQEIQGQLAEGYPNLLLGLTIATQSYRLVCEERLEEAISTGRHITSLFLKQIERLP